MLDASGRFELPDDNPGAPFEDATAAAPVEIGEVEIESPADTQAALRAGHDETMSLVGEAYADDEAADLTDGTACVPPTSTPPIMIYPYATVSIVGSESTEPAEPALSVTPGSRAEVDHQRSGSQDEDDAEEVPETLASESYAVTELPPGPSSPAQASGSGELPPGGGNEPPGSGNGDDGESPEDPNEDNDEEADSEAGSVESTVDAESDSSEVEEIRRQVKDSAAKVVAELSRSPSAMHGLAVGSLASAIANVEGIARAHEFVEETISTLSLESTERATAWTTLYEKGDQAALPEARRAVALASEEMGITDVMGPSIGGQRTAERLVRLAEAGDETSIDSAKPFIDTSPARDKPRLYAGLYRAGDTASLGQVVEAVRQARVYAEMLRPNDEFAADEVLSHAEYELNGMAQHAIEHGKPDHALTLVSHLEDQAHRAIVHANLYAAGREESLQPALSYMENAELATSQEIQRQLAKTGYEPAIEALREQTAADLANPSNTYRYTFKLATDLVALHQSGDPEAAENLERALRQIEDVDPVCVRKLAEVGRKDAAIDILKTSLTNADKWNRIGILEGLVALGQDRETWESYFNLQLHQRHNPSYAATLVEVLSQWAE